MRICKVRSPTSKFHGPAEATGVTSAALPIALLAEWIDESYRAVAPKKLGALVGQGGPKGMAEGTGANAFFVKDGALHTPTPDCFLNGITRQTVIELAQRSGIEVIERAIWPEELADFEQFFVTGSAAEIVPVGSAGPWNFEVGDLTRQMQKDYSDLVRGKLTL